MKLNRLLILSAALLALLTDARAQNESLASIITNADTRVVPARRASIIYIQCHGLGYGDLSCYGQTNFQTPNLDKLAAEGVRFTNFRPGGTNFSTALATLVSGKKSGALTAPTVAERLQAAGYATGLIGEWTLGEKPWTQGFDEFAGYLRDEEGRNYFSDHVWRFAPKAVLNTNNVQEDWVGSEMIYENIDGKRGRYLPEVFVNALCSFIGIHKPDQFNAYKPFFLLVNLSVPRSAKAGADEFPVPSDAPFTDENWPPAAKNRAALITRLDGSIGRVFEKFKTLGITNNVAIFFSSSAAPEKFADARMDFLKPGGAQKGGAATLPMIVRWPEEIPAGRVSRFHWSGADFTPTALELANVKPVKGLDGISILPALRGQTQTNRLEETRSAPK